MLVYFHPDVPEFPRLDRYYLTNLIGNPLDTSIAIPWLAEKYRAEVVTLTMDVGQGRELEDVRARALAIGMLAVPLFGLLAFTLIVILAAIVLTPVAIVQRYRLGTARRRARGWVAAVNAVGLALSVVLFLIGAALLVVFQICLLD